MHCLNIKHTACIRMAFSQQRALRAPESAILNHGLHKQKRHTAGGNEAKTTVMNCFSTEVDERKPLPQAPNNTVW